MEKPQTKTRTKREQKIIDRLEKEVLNKLYETSLEIPEKERGKIHKMEITLGPVDDVGDPIYGEEFLFLKSLEKIGIIKSIKKLQKLSEEYKPWALEMAEDPEEWYEYKKDFMHQELMILEVSAKPYDVIDYCAELKTGKGKVTILILDRYGNLYKENEKQRCYPIEATSGRYKIVKFLAENSGFQAVLNIREASGSKDNKTVRGEIIKIRGNVRKNLGLNGKEFIEGKKGSGYRIGTKFKIKKE